MNTEFSRMLDEEREPSEKEIRATIGEAACWRALRKYIEKNYDFAPELVFYGKKYGWTIRYRKSGKTLCSLFPERRAFTVLVVLGRQEADKVLDILPELTPYVRKLIGSTKQLRDGRWLWIRVRKPSQVEDVKRLLVAKRKPKHV